MVMTHSDNKGLVFPPHTNNPSTQGNKFSHWEMRGVPLRLELGPTELLHSAISYTRRDSGLKGTISLSEILTQVPLLLENIQHDMFDRASGTFRLHIMTITNWDAVLPVLNDRNLVLIPFCKESDCEGQIKEITKSRDGELEVGDGKPLPRMGMKSLCIPFEQPGESVTGRMCVNPECGRAAKSWVLFGRSY